MDKQTWWLNEDAQHTVKSKKAALKEWLLSKTNTKLAYCHHLKSAGQSEL